MPNPPEERGAERDERLRVIAQRMAERALVNLTLSDAENEAYPTMLNLTVADIRTILTLTHHATITLPEGPTQ